MRGRTRGGGRRDQHTALDFYYRGASTEIRKIVGSIIEWIVNSHPTWEAYCALIKGKLMGMDNQPIIRPVGIGKT